MKNSFDSKKLPTWCPGCGNFTIHASLKMALESLNIKPSQTFISFDIGCNGNGADVINTYAFKGLHGRSIPLAVGAHLANRKYTVIADIGDGGCLHEGLDHLLHAIRSNYDITSTHTQQPELCPYNWPSNRNNAKRKIRLWISNWKTRKQY